MSRILQSTEDPTIMGRSSAVQLRGKKQETIWFISVYGVSQDTLLGLQTSYAQQHEMLLDADVQDPRPKRHFVVNLTKFITDITKKNEHVILALDANKVLSLSSQPASLLSRETLASRMYTNINMSHGGTRPTRNNTK